MKVQNSENTLVITEEFIFDQNKLPWDPNSHFNIKNVGENTKNALLNEKQFHVLQYIEISTVKPVKNGHSKIDKTKFLLTNGSLMKAESIAECSPWSILQYF